MSIKTTRFDATEYLKNDADVAKFVSLAIEEARNDTDPQALLTCLATAAKAYGMARLAEDVKVSRRGLYKALAPGGNPSFALVAAIAMAMGSGLRLAPAKPQKRRAA